MALTEITSSDRNKLQFSLLSDSLRRRNPRDRFTHLDKRQLTIDLQNAWMNNPEWSAEIARIIDFSAIAEMGYYIDGELSIKLNTNMEREILDNPMQPLYVVTNMETPDDLLGVEAVLDELQNPHTTIATMYSPLQRGDRPELKPNNQREVVLLRTFLRNLYRSGVRRMIVCDSHSPVFTQLALEQGIRILDLTILPLLFNHARTVGLLEGAPLYAVSGDDGASEMGELVASLACHQGYACDQHLTGSKQKRDGKTTIEFPADKLVQLQGKVAVIAEDIISTGKTLNNVIDQLLSAGAARVVVLVAYPIFAGEALQILGNNY